MKKILFLTALVAVLATGCIRETAPYPQQQYPNPNQNPNQQGGGYGGGTYQGPGNAPGAGVSAIILIYQYPLGSGMSVEFRQRPSSNGTAEGWIYETGYIAAPVLVSTPYSIANGWYPNMKKVAYIEEDGTWNYQFNCPGRRLSIP